MAKDFGKSDIVVAFDGMDKQARNVIETKFGQKDSIENVLVWSVVAAIESQVQVRFFKTLTANLIDWQLTMIYFN